MSATGELFTRPMTLPTLVGVERTGWVVSQLALARGSRLDGPTASAYMDALGDLDPAMVERACFDLARVARRDYESAVPSAPAIRERCEQIARADAEVAAKLKLLPAPKSEEDAPTYFCLSCLDESSGWRTATCLGAGAQRQATLPLRLAGPEVEPCGRTEPHGPHAFVVRCHCRGFNPVVAARRERQQARRPS